MRKGRNKGSHKAILKNRTVLKNKLDSALQRLDKVAYPKTINDKNPRKGKTAKYQGDSSCIVPLPAENKVRILAKKFLKTYYDLFDQPSRPNLASQYSAESFFSFSATHPLPTIGRNLIDVRDPQQRVSMLIHDRNNIATALSAFPLTEHLSSCMTFDVPFYNANPMSISFLKVVVTGVYKDASQASDPLRAFTRIFILKHTSFDAQEEPIYHIFNDIFMVQLPTRNQIHRYHQAAQAAKKQTGGQPENLHPDTGLVSSDKAKERMIQSVMFRTKMNRLGATKLLGERDWNEDDAVLVFDQVNSAGSIPREYFAPS